MAVAPDRPSRIFVWDATTRLGHWLLVGLFAFSWWSAEYGYMEYHRYSGYTVLGILIYRLYWGFFGASTARFAQFVKGPGSVWKYVRSRAPQVSPGHNPLGALNVLALLALLLVQVGLGLFAVDVDGLESGPLSHRVSFEAGRVCAEWHETVFNVLLVVIALHILAVAYYGVVRKDNLVSPMVTGWKRWSGTPPQPAHPAPLWRVIVGIALAAGVVWWIS